MGEHRLFDRRYFRHVDGDLFSEPAGAYSGIAKPPGREPTKHAFVLNYSVSAHAFT